MLLIRWETKPITTRRHEELWTWLVELSMSAVHQPRQLYGPSNPDPGRTTHQRSVSSSSYGGTVDKVVDSICRFLSWLQDCRISVVWRMPMRWCRLIQA